MLNFLSNKLKSREKLLVMLYISYIWLPIRKKLIHDIGRASPEFAHRSNKRANEIPNPEVPSEHSISVNLLLPNLNICAKLYYSLSTATHLLIFTSNMLLLTKLFDNSELVKCYSPKFSLHRVLSQFYMQWFGCVFSLLHLIWRFLVFVVERDFKLSSLTFLLINNETIEKAILHCEKLRKIKKTNNELSLIEDILYYKIEDKSEHTIKLMLRPNRTSEARAIMDKYVNNLFDVSIKLFVLSFVFLAPLALNSIFIEQQMIYDSLGCSKKAQFPDALYFIRTLPSFWITFIIWLDSFLALLFPITLSIIIIDDLSLYWAHVNADLDVMLDLMFLRHQKLKEDEVMIFSKRGLYNCHQLNENLHPTIIMENADMEKKLIQLRAIMCDFFKQLGFADKFLSLMITFVLACWLLINAVITLIGLQLQLSSDSVIIRSFQFMGLVIITRLTFYILKFKTNTGSAYRKLNSLMSLDPLLRSKRKWVGILKFYTEKSRFGITLWHNETYTLLTFFKIFSYTFTFIFLFDGIRHLK